MNGGSAAPLADQVERLFLAILRQRDEPELDQPPLTNTQRVALFIVASQGSQRLHTLAERMATTNATASRTVDGLEALGLVRREADPHDRRGVIVTPTPAASKLVADRRRRLVRTLELGRGHLTAADQERLVSLLGHLNDVLER